MDVNNSRGIVTFRFEAATYPSDYLCRAYIRVPEQQYINLTFLGFGAITARDTFDHLAIVC